MTRTAPPTPFNQFPFGRSLPRTGAGRIPITIVSGFLGAGKTSLVKALLASPEGQGTALIVNEFGEIGIDDALLREGGERVKLIGAGCVCCAAQTELHATLRDLFAERERGAIPPFRRVIVETSGLADPSAALQSLATDRTLADRYALVGLVVVVDAANASTTAETHPEWSKQVALADRLVITKTDLVTAGDVVALRRMLSAVNPDADVLLAGETLCSPLLDTPGRNPSRLGFLAGLPPVRPEHSRAYRTFALTYDAPLAWDAFAKAMDMLATLRGADLLRVKGLVNVAGRPGPVVVHFVQHLAHKPEELRQWPDADRRTRIVFITTRLEKAQVASLLDAAIGLAATVPPEPHGLIAAQAE